MEKLDFPYIKFKLGDSAEKSADDEVASYYTFQDKSYSQFRQNYSEELSRPFMFPFILQDLETVPPQLESSKRDESVDQIIALNISAGNADSLYLTVNTFDAFMLGEGEYPEEKVHALCFVCSLLCGKIFDDRVGTDVKLFLETYKGKYTQEDLLLTEIEVFQKMQCLRGIGNSPIRFISIMIQELKERSKAFINRYPKVVLCLEIIEEYAKLVCLLTLFDFKITCKVYL